ncbi:DNA alkylation repair protein [Candidatus Gottesmanbacteria bacterium]|nr:DNA alkylation repair protein [Candidatus Gottesmanbacteria bacterium]
MNVKSEYDFFLTQLKRHARRAGRFNLGAYLGSDHVVYNVPVPRRRSIALGWSKNHKAITQKECIELVDSLIRGKSHEEKGLASMILGRFPKYLTALPEHYWDRWLGELLGWAEVDAICDEIDVWLRADVAKRMTMVMRWNTDPQIEKRRASLVVLCSSVRSDDSKRLRDLSFALIDARNGEKHVMITKAISWLLRALIKYHKVEVARYLKKNASTLPRIAVREVTRKLETGRK